RNNEALLDLAASHRVPVVVITPVGNLRAEPYGDLDTTSALYRKGMTTPDYDQAWAYLKQAQDTEIFTYDLRAKSPLVSYIRNLRRPGVYVLDLERVLKERRFGFGDAEFLDYFHFNDRSHRVVAGLIYDFLKQHRLAGARSEPGR